jgi:hypothetical protein
VNDWLALLPWTVTTMVLRLEKMVRSIMCGKSLHLMRKCMTVVPLAQVVDTVVFILILLNVDDDMASD